MSFDKRKKIVVLCVDRDADIRVLNIKTPIIGFNNVLKAATEYAIKKPEDADTNALFAALNTAKRLKEEGFNVEVAIIAGDPVDDLKAGIRVKEETKEVLDKTGASSAIIVSDGADDELIIPIVSSLTPIESVRRVIVEQSRGVEETYILIGRYLRKIIGEPRFSRIFLGVPGVIILVASIFTAIGLIDKAMLAALAIIGFTMIYRGFSLDRKIEEWWESSPVIFVSAILAIFSLVLGTLYTLLTVDLSKGVLAWSKAVYIITPFIITSIVLLLGGKAIVKVIRRDIKVWHEAVGFVFTVLLFKILNITAKILEQVAYTSPGEIINPILSSELFLWLGVTIGVIGLLTGLFTIIEKSVREDILRKRALARLRIRAKLKRLKAVMKIKEKT
ncbi:MAG: hypothetical protein B6U75_01170 [Desulfurococcales archaeon ex4484_217_1]|nr:MAG: hypothetical protein B6U75_01170 [Desulfurococcales archaeon ex4484_217_1]